MRLSSAFRAAVDHRHRRLDSFPNAKMGSLQLHGLEQFYQNCPPIPKHETRRPSVKLGSRLRHTHEDIVDVPQFVVAEAYPHRAQVLLDLRWAFRADQNTGHGREAKQPGDCQLH